MQRQLRELSASLEGRLLRGEHLMLLGPRGSGKSSLLQDLYAQLHPQSVPCAFSAVTTSLDHITCALERAYPGVDTRGISRRAARMRLWNAADGQAGVLLLDQFRGASSAMVSFLRRLHGGITGVLSAVDVDDEQERRGVQSWRYGAMSVRMPLASRRQLRRLLLERAAALGLPTLDAMTCARLLAAARGRVGWIVRCTELARHERYWRTHGPLVSVICLDTEADVRCDALKMLDANPEVRSGVIDRSRAESNSASSSGARHGGDLSTRRPSAGRTHRD